VEKNEKIDFQSVLIDILEPHLDELNHMDDLELKGLIMGLCNLKLVDEDGVVVWDFNSENPNFRYIYSDTLNFLEVKNKNWTPNLFFDFCGIEGRPIDELFVHGFGKRGLTLFDSEGLIVESCESLIQG
jgi:hypothetical protein